MSERIVLEQCSPTLAGMKTGSLFGYEYESEDALHSAISEYNRLFTKKGLRMLPLKKNGNRALIYVYRPKQLDRDISHSLSKRILRSYGYDTSCHSKAVLTLIKRLEEAEGFPHEIGLFLGYPPEDVDGFIRNKATEFKCCGYWKVYGNEKEAEKTFERFRKCTEAYCRCFEIYGSLNRLVIGA